MGISCGVSENTFKCYHIHPNCFQMLSWTCYTIGKFMLWNNLLVGDCRVRLLVCGQNSIRLLMSPLERNLIKQLLFCNIVTIVQVLPRVLEKKSFWSENFAFLFCLCVTCTGWRGEESKEEVVGRIHLWSNAKKFSPTANPLKMSLHYSHLEGLYNHTLGLEMSQEQTFVWHFQGCLLPAGKKCFVPSTSSSHGNMWKWEIMLKNPQSELNFS